MLSPAAGCGLRACGITWPFTSQCAQPLGHGRACERQRDHARDDEDEDRQQFRNDAKIAPATRVRFVGAASVRWTIY